MTDAEKIAALAAELTRLNKMPNWVSIGRITGRPLIEAADSYDALEVMPDAVLAALSGVAAEVIATDGVTIRFSFGEWSLRDEMLGSLGREPTYHEALIAALKQVESEVQNG